MCTRVYIHVIRDLTKKHLLLTSSFLIFFKKKFNDSNSPIEKIIQDVIDDPFHVQTQFFLKIKNKLKINITASLILITIPLLYVVPR